MPSSSSMSRIVSPASLPSRSNRHTPRGRGHWTYEVFGTGTWAKWTDPFSIFASGGYGKLANWARHEPSQAHLRFELRIRLDDEFNFSSV